MAELRRDTTVGGIDLVIDLIYPVGSVYMITDANFNPGTTWVSNNLMIYKNGACQAIEFVEDPADETNYLHATGVWQAPEFVEAED